MVKTGIVLCGVAALGIGAFTPFLQAQTQTDAGFSVIQVESREVPVDVIVTGKAAAAGKLTAKDFAIREDGTAQKINSVEPAAADPETSWKHFVLYFDTSAMTMADQQASKDAATGFVESMASPDRYMAVVNMSTLGSRVLQDFTTSPAALSKAIAGVGLARAPIRVGPQRYDLSVSLAAVCRSMAPATGRKAVLFFGTYYSDGPALDRSTYRGGGIEACNRANVGVYAIEGYFSPVVDAGGNGGRMGGAGVLPSVALASPQSDLAEQTGGLAFGITPALKEQLAAVARERDDYYRVFYTPPPSKDGVCHDLRVSVNVRGLSARARTEYCTEKQPDVVAGKIAGQSLETRAAGGAASTLNAAMQLPYFYTGTNRASVRLAADFVPADMKFTDASKGLHGEIDIVGTALRPDGSTAARFADSVDIDQENRQSADAFMKTHYHYEQQFFVTPGTYVFRLEIGAGPNAVGKVELPLKVDPWKPGSLAMGSLALSTDAQPVDPAASLAPMLEGQGPLIAEGKQFVPAAANVFQKSGPAYFYTEFYDPVLGGANPPMIDPSVLKMEYCILEQTTGNRVGCSDVVSLENFVRAGDPVVPFGTHLPVAQLPAGLYRLEVRAVIPASQEAATRTIDFEVR